MVGRFIVFEGVEGCGKTTQMQLCHQWLSGLGVSVLVTREPGGTELGAHLRRLLLSKSENQPINQLTELLLYAADRAQHVEQELKPHLAQGKCILCDRYIYSTIAYQGYGRGLDLGLINQLNYIATSGLNSDLTIWLDVDVEEGLTRKRGNLDVFDRIEQENLAFHRRVQQGYQELAATDSARIVRVDGSFSQDVVHKTIREMISDRFF
ncbi:MAG TPA: dTMP kinase [Nostocaceae cyanobacterium]|nr:dTMP kinase [Nostocaceae cyanobacterium]